MRAYVLYFNSNDVVEFLQGEVNDGILTVGDKSFYVGDKDAYSLKLKQGLFGIKPLYIVHHKSIYPVKMRLFKGVDKKKGKKIDAITTTFIVEKDRKFTPDALYRTINLKILGGMLKIGDDKRTALLYAIIGAVIGALSAAISMYFMNGGRII